MPRKAIAEISAKPRSQYCAGYAPESRKEVNPLSHNNLRQKRNKAQIIAEIDSKLPSLPMAQQNLVAAYAQGIRTGLALQASFAAVTAAEPLARDPDAAVKP